MDMNNDTFVVSLVRYIWTGGKPIKEELLAVLPIEFKGKYEKMVEIGYMLMFEMLPQVDAMIVYIYDEKNKRGVNIVFCQCSLEARDVGVALIQIFRELEI